MKIILMFHNIRPLPLGECLPPPPLDSPLQAEGVGAFDRFAALSGSPGLEVKLFIENILYCVILAVFVMIHMYV